MKKLTVLFFVFLMTAPAFSSGDLENQFYLRFGLSRPTKGYLGVDNDSYWDNTKRVGGVFELGSIFMLNSINLMDGMRLGINADYAEFTYHQLKYNNDDVVGVFSLASKVGPSFSYSPVDDLVFDVYFKGKLNWLTGLAYVYDDSANDTETYGGVMSAGFATGINVRYKFLMVAFEFNKTKTKLKHSDSDTYIGDLGSSSDKTPLPYMNIMFGFSF